eukprot:1435343-Rhodomonas_salina.1
MECTIPAVEKKWVIDIDGDVAVLHRCGLCESADTCSAAEASNVETLALRYAALVVRCLRE